MLKLGGRRFETNPNSLHHRPTLKTSNLDASRRRSTALRTSERVAPSPSRNFGSAASNAASSTPSGSALEMRASIPRMYFLCMIVYSNCSASARESEREGKCYKGHRAIKIFPRDNTFFFSRVIARLRSVTAATPLATREWRQYNRRARHARAKPHIERAARASGGQGGKRVSFVCVVSSCEAEQERGRAFFIVYLVFVLVHER